MEQWYRNNCNGEWEQWNTYRGRAIGSHSCMKLLKEREYFKQGLDFVMDRLRPSTVIVYGTAPDEIFSPYRHQSIEILQFDSETALAHKAVSV